MYDMYRQHTSNVGETYVWNQKKHETLAKILEKKSYKVVFKAEFLQNFFYEHYNVIHCWKAGESNFLLVMIVL